MAKPCACFTRSELLQPLPRPRKGGGDAPSPCAAGVVLCFWAPVEIIIDSSPREAGVDFGN